MIPEYKKNRYAIADKLLDLPKVSSALRAVRDPLVLAGCRDIWCRDFMPIQTERGFVQFVYMPDYLVEDPSTWATTTVPGVAYPEWLGARTTVVPIILDGGSIIGNEHFALVSERCFIDNPGWKKSYLETAMKNALEVDQIEWIPECPGDFTGHLDGTVRLVSEHQVVLGMPVPYTGRSKYRKDQNDAFCRYSETLRRHIGNLGLDVIEIVDASHLAPAAPQDNTFGVYANFLQVGPKSLLLPRYGCEHDDEARKQLESAGFEVSPIDAGEFVDPLAPMRAGGAINCVTWTWMH